MVVVQPILPLLLLTGDSRWNWCWNLCCWLCGFFGTFDGYAITRTNRRGLPQTAACTVASTPERFSRPSPGIHAAKIRSSTFLANSAGSCGGAISSTPAPIEIEDSYFRANVAGELGGAFCQNHAVHGRSWIDRSTFEGNEVRMDGK